MSNANPEWPVAGSGQIPSLDGLRAVSIMLVFFSHAGLSSLIPGGFGVTVFFFLSGFLITNLMVREYLRSGRVNLVSFYMRRVLRLGPPLLLTISLAIALCLNGLVPGEIRLDALLSQVFFLYNYYSLFPGSSEGIRGLGILWSLSVEEHFYLIWPFIFVLVTRGVVRSLHLVVALVGIMIWRTYRFYAWGDGEWEIYVSTDTRIDSLLYGCLLSLMMARGRLPVWLQRREALYALVAGALVLLVATFLWRGEAFRSTLRYSVQGIALIPIFYYAIKQPDHWCFRVLNFPIMRRIGVYSYTLYLVHFVVLYSLWEAGWPNSGASVTIVVAAVLSLTWAAIVYRFAEQPLHGLRSRLASRSMEA